MAPCKNNGCPFLESNGTDGYCSNCYISGAEGTIAQKSEMAPCKNNGCPFLESNGTDGYCSNCYKTHGQTTPDPQVETFGDGKAKDASKRKRKAKDVASDGDRSGLSGSEEKVLAAAPLDKDSPSGHLSADKRDVVRCCFCNKKLKLVELTFNCRCGKVFCSSHRQSEKHSCTYDYKTTGRAAIEDANPVVKRAKIEKI